jgi:hypothetical protein
MLMALINMAKLKNLRCIVWCMIICSMLRELLDMLPGSDDQQAQQEMTRLIKLKLHLYEQTHIREISAIQVPDIEIQMNEISEKIQEIEHGLRYKTNQRTSYFEMLAKASAFIEAIEHMTTMKIPEF